MYSTDIIAVDFLPFFRRPFSGPMLLRGFVSHLAGSVVVRILRNALRIRFASLPDGVSLGFRVCMFKTTTFLGEYRRISAGRQVLRVVGVGQCQRRRILCNVKMIAYPTYIVFAITSGRDDGGTTSHPFDDVFVPIGRPNINRVLSQLLFCVT